MLNLKLSKIIKYYLNQIYKNISNFKKISDVFFL